MHEEILSIKASFGEALSGAATSASTEDVRIRYLGRKSALTSLLRGLKDLPEDKRRSIGAEANQLRHDMEGALADKEQSLAQKSDDSTLKKEWLDVTRPGLRSSLGHIHPLTKIRREIENIFSSMGFTVAEGPEVETEHYNFNVLNMPETHPAREMQDTWWLTHNAQDRLLLRTQVTEIQVRFMEKNSPPFRIIMPGAVYRREATDASHEMQFFQMDGAMVDKKVSFADLKGVMETVMRRLFGDRVKTRLRAGYFPFVEPGVELDIECLACGQKGCSICKQTGWIEIFPGGMMHPHVFRAAGYDPKEWQGIAFNLGLDRVAMMKYHIPDIRLFRSGDLRFLNQF